MLIRSSLFILLFLLSFSQSTMATMAATRRDPVLVEFQPSHAFSATSARLLNSDWMARTEHEVPAHYLNLWIVHGAAVLLSENEIDQVRTLPWVRSVRTLGRRAHVLATASSPASTRANFSSNSTYGLEKIRATDLRAVNPERDGRGTRVGIIDTGIEASHPAFLGKHITFRDFTSTRADAYDDHGHGTHVAGTVAGRPVQGEDIGVAPAAELVIAKAFDREGHSLDQHLLEALQWMAENKVQVVSNSWTVDANTTTVDPADEPFCQAVQTLVQLNILPVFAAGNDGPGASTVGVPAACPQSIAVGATDDSDLIADFSSRGPAHWKSKVIDKPDISAPGVDIESAGLGGGLTMKSGTSMAAPHVAGSLALLVQDLKPEGAAWAREALFRGAKHFGADARDPAYGWGRVDLVESFKTPNENLE